MNFKMVHTEVHVLDLDASLAFYKETSYMKSRHSD